MGWLGRAEGRAGQVDIKSSQNTRVPSAVTVTVGQWRRSEVRSKPASPGGQSRGESPGSWLWYSGRAGLCCIRLPTFRKSLINNGFLLCASCSARH